MRNSLVLHGRRAEGKIPARRPPRRQPNFILTLVVGILAGLIALSAPGYAQPNGMPNSPGPLPQTGSLAQRPQIGGTVRSTQTRVSVQRPRSKETAQRAPTKVTLHVQTKETAPRTQTKETVQRVQTKPMPARTIGAHTAAKPPKPEISKTPMPVAAPAKIAMPVPAPELLAPLSEPNCAFDKTRTDADDRQKLDYERQCYRHAEMIVRARFERLQGDVEQMITAAKRGESVSASR